MFGIIGVVCGPYLPEFGIWSSRRWPEHNFIFEI